jgi:hypothetical protein
VTGRVRSDTTYSMPKAPKRVLRATCFGSTGYADRHGVLGSADVVRVARSTVCDGLGVFAARFVPAGAVITWYAGRVVSRPVATALTALEQSYVYEIRRDGSRATTCILGESSRAQLLGRGVAQLANDAIDPEVSGRANNCEFVERVSKGKVRVYLAATRDVRAGEELLVPYHLGYWLPRAGDEGLPRNVRTWLECQARIQARLQAALGVTIAEYHGILPAIGPSSDPPTGVARYTVEYATDPVLAPVPTAAEAQAVAGCPHTAKRVWMLDVHLVAPEAGDPAVVQTDHDPVTHWRCARCS